MKRMINILDESILKENIRFAALFILYFECLKDFFVSKMRGFLSDDYVIKDGALLESESQKYKDEVKRLDPKNNNRLSAALMWFNEAGAISDADINLFFEARDRRNTITHELINELLNGFSKRDTQLLSSIISLYSKLDKWWINEIEIPIAGEFAPDEYDPDEVSSVKAELLSLIYDVTNGNADSFEEIRALLKTYNDFNNQIENCGSEGT